MKKVKSDPDELRPEYRRSDFKKLERGKYYERLKANSNIVVLDAELAADRIRTMRTNDSGILGASGVKLFIVVGIFIVASCVGFALIAHRFGDWALLNQFGGAFTVLGAVFSGLAFAAIFVALRVQVKQLQVQRQELEKTREQAIEQRQAFEEEQFERKFFELLRVFINSVNSIDTGNRNVPLVGNNWFTTFHNNLRNAVLEARSPAQLNEGYEGCYRQLQAVLGQYFQNLDLLVRFVDNRWNTSNDFFVDVIRAQLTIDQRAFLFYHCFSNRGENMRRLVLKYQLFGDVSEAGLLAHPAHKSFLPEDR